ncbi:MAG: T9SS type A sorting domain-containing protein [Bacteroidetes bacterium]|nr:T9SS type A sorting domain-containing protein [Bacteroidota bacterium]
MTAISVPQSLSIHGGTGWDNLTGRHRTTRPQHNGRGWTRSYGFGNPSNRDIYLVKTDSAGNLIWQKTFGTSLFESAYTICPTLDGNYIITGGREANINGNPYQVYLIKVDTSGKKIWDKSYNFGIESDCHRLRELPNGDLIGCGLVSYNGQEGGLIFKLDSTGKEQWHRLYTVNSSSAIFRDVRATTDGGFICAGFAFIGNSGNQDAWLVKVDSLGCDSAGCPIYTAIEETTSAQSITNEVRCNPNPCCDFANIHTRMLSIYGLVLYDINGREVAIRHRATSHNSIQLDTSVLTVSIYVAKILTDGGDLYVRLVKGN